MPGHFERLRAALGDTYRLEREIGRGGMASVYLAEDLRHHRSVAVKVLHPELAQSIGAERFLREIDIAARLSHPHILPLHDSGERDGFLFYVMPFVDGESLRHRLDRERQLPVEDAMRILREVADALAYAHSMGVVHRDIKPENILLHEGHAVVSDFGVARALAAQGTQGITESGMAVGTPAYMSPEQASGETHVDGRSDVYALAAVFYEMLAGEPPYTGPTPQAIFARQMSGEVRSLTPVRLVTAALDTVLRKALARSAADRYATPTQFADAVNEVIQGRLKAEPAAGPRGRRWMWAVAATVLIGIGLVAGWQLLASRAERAATVVVLPLANVGSDSTNQPFVDGMMEVLTSKLTQLEPFFDRPLWVIPASEVRSRHTESADAARREFGATLALSGSVQRLGDAISLTLNLVDAVTLRQLRSDVVRGSVDDVALWQDGVIGRVADMLDFNMRPTAQHVLEAGGTSRPEAYDLYVQARGYLQSAQNGAQFQRAAEVFQRAINEDPGFALAHAGLAEAQWHLYGETRDTIWVGRAIATSRRALDLNDSLPAVWVTLGLIHNGTGQYANATADLERALTIDPSNSEATRLLAEAQAHLGNTDEAEATYRRAIALKPYDWRAHNALGVFYYQQGRYEDAAAEFLQVTELNPLNFRGYSNAGGMYFYLDRWDDARRLFQRANQVEPNLNAYSNLGTIDFYEGRFRSAAQNFERAVQFRKQDYQLWGNWADALYWTAGERTRSRATYRRAIELADGARRVNPNDPDLLSSLANYHAALGDTAVATNLLRQLEPLAGDDPRLMFNAAWANETLGRRDAALQWLGKAFAGGYSRRIIENSPDLRALRADPRYAALVPK